MKLLQEYGLDFRYLLDDILLETPKKSVESAPALVSNENRVSKVESSVPALSIKKPDRPPRQVPSATKKQEPQDLPPPPPPPMLSAAPSSTRRKKASAPLVLVGDDASGDRPVGPRAPASYHSNETLHPQPRGGSNSFTSHSAYSSRIESAQTTSRSPPSAMRSRTPVSAMARQDQVSMSNTTPVPSSPLVSPLARPPTSATPFRMRSDSYSSQVESLRGGGYESPREGSYRERPPRSARASPAPRSPAPAPPRSANRPVAFAQHDGMI